MTEKFSGSGYASISESRMAVTFVAHYLSIGPSITVNVEPSPMPHGAIPSSQHFLEDRKLSVLGQYLRS